MFTTAKQPGQSDTTQPAARTSQNTTPQVFNPLWQQMAWGAQAKLAVSSPDDPAEHEADHVANRIMTMPQSVVQRKCTACGSSTTPCPKCAEEQNIQRKANVGTTAATPKMSQLGGGAPLDHGSRSFFEPRFNRHFDAVRVHTDANAAESAATMGARAFTIGSNIAFASGQYQPATSDGKKLLAHELTHVVQQNSAHDDSSEGSNATGVSIATHGGEPAIQRACVAGLIPQLRCCIPGLSARRIGTIAHQQLQIGAGLISPGTIGEVAIPLMPHGLPPSSRGWRFADLYNTSPASPVRAPSRAGLPAFPGRFHPEINPLGWPVARVPPAGTASSVGIGEIKPMSVHGFRAGPADLARNIAQYDVWSMSTSGRPISMSPVIPGGMLGNPLNLLFGFQTIPGLYNYCCLDARRIARAVARALRRAWEALKELWRRFMEWLEEHWEAIVIILLIIIAIILIIVFWEAIVAAIIAVGEAILAFLEWLLDLIIGGGGELPAPPVEPPVPIEPPAPVEPPVEPPIPLRPPVPAQPPAPPLAAAASVLGPLHGFVASYQAVGPAQAGSGTVDDEDVDAAPDFDGTGNPLESPAMPMPVPSEVDAKGAETAALVDALVGGAVRRLSGYLGNMSSMPTQSTGLGDALLDGAHVRLAPLLSRMHGSDLHAEARQMIGQFFARAHSTRPRS